MSGLKINKIDQIGIVVENCEAAAKMFENLLGIGPFQILDRGAESMLYKGKPSKIHVKNALCRLNNIQIELIEVIEVIEGACVQKDFLDKNGPGLHHIGIYIEDLDNTVNQMEKEGFNLLQKGTADGFLNWAYLDTQDKLGFVIELLELKKKKSVKAGKE